MRFFIAEDDIHIALFIKKSIEEVKSTEVIGIANNGLDTIREVNFLQPDTLFLDIVMPDINGIEVAETLLNKHKSLNIVFCTGYSDFALKAFELYSFDYIMKPFNEKRIKQTVQRLISTVHKKNITTTMFNQRLLFQLGEKKIFIDTEDISYIESSNSKLLIKTKKKEYVVAGDLYTLQNRLNPTRFFRCHKGYIVNIKEIDEIFPSGRTYEMKLKSGETILLSREREKVLRQRYALK